MSTGDRKSYSSRHTAQSAANPVADRHLIHTFTYDHLRACVYSARSCFDGQRDVKPQGQEENPYRLEIWAHDEKFFDCATDDIQRLAELMDAVQNLVYQYLLRDSTYQEFCADYHLDPQRRQSP